jgi:hypothetical protein
MKPYIPYSMCAVCAAGLVYSLGWYGIPLSLLCYVAGHHIGMTLIRFRRRPVTHWRWWAADVRVPSEDHIYPLTITDWVTTMPDEEAVRHVPKRFSDIDGRTVFRIESWSDGHMRSDLSQFTQHETRVFADLTYDL